MSVLLVFQCSMLRAETTSPVCGNGIVEDGEQCDPGNLLGSEACNTLCQRIAFEPFGLPFGQPMSELTAESPMVPRIYSPGLYCKPASVRDDSRLRMPVHVRYRIHLCRNAAGIDAFTEKAVRDVMADAAAEFAKASILLEEESLVHFTESDCNVPLDTKGWSDALVGSTPAGVLSVIFVNAISSSTSQFGVGGFCYFFGPMCVNAGAYDTLVIHELGHFFGLAHTFECTWGKETAATCANDGDFLCDTPPDRGPAGVSGIAVCEDGSVLNGSCTGLCGAKTCSDGSKPDGYDWMSYYHCMPGHFTAEQQDFLRCTLDHELRSYNADAIVPSTTTTLPFDGCGDVNEDGEITAGDALGILRAGVGALSCATWKCDYDGSGKVTAVDALEVLKVAVGEGGGANCPSH